MAKKIKKGKDIETVTISGYIDEYEIDEDTYGLIITTNNTDEYIVTLDRVGKELFEYVDEELEVTGEVSINKEGEQVIKVKNYVVPEYDYDYDDDDDDQWDSDRYDD